MTCTFASPLTASQLHSTAALQSLTDQHHGITDHDRAAMGGHVAHASGGLALNEHLEAASAITSGGPTHTHMSPTRAAGMPPIKTGIPPGGRMGPPTCGMGGTAGV